MKDTPEKAIEVAAARQSLDVYIKEVVDRAPELTPERAFKLRTLLSDEFVKPLSEDQRIVQEIIDIEAEQDEVWSA